jgi:hypothetical protein
MLKYIYIAILCLIPAISFAGEFKSLSKICAAAEQRSLPGMSSEEFIEDSYIGEYTFENDQQVIIEDDRSESGHLILKADVMGLDTPLYRFNKYIYVYGTSPDSPEPILGTVTFLSDGEHVNQILWQHNAKQAFFPMRSDSATAQRQAGVLSKELLTDARMSQHKND